MPYKTIKLKGGKVRVSSPSGVRAKFTTPTKAKKQIRLLNALEHDPSFRDKLRKRVMQHD
jgi:hypothetical protein